MKSQTNSNRYLECLTNGIGMRLIIFKVKKQFHFIERKDKLIELLKGRTVKIVETLNDPELYIYVQNERCSSRILRPFFTNVIYCEFKWSNLIYNNMLLVQLKIQWMDIMKIQFGSLSRFHRVDTFQKSMNQFDNKEHLVK